ncbi:MAG TPA: hypothetical protein P5250_00465 [Bacteroidales bacterium]|nr:hypothetical protein [Bacteroidales bacterium]
MKTSKNFLRAILLSLFMITLVGSMLMGQNQQSMMGAPGGGFGCKQKCMINNNDNNNAYWGIPDLSPEQQKKIDELRLKLQKDLLPINLKLNEKKAQLKLLETDSPAKISDINKIIDDITTLENQKMKIKAQHKQDIRASLNEKQRVFFDTKKGKGMKNCCGGRYGCGFGL